jgi:Secretion system C-terminal sorting domain
MQQYFSFHVKRYEKIQLYMKKNSLYFIAFVLMNCSAFAQTINVEWANPQGTVPNFMTSLNIWDGVNPSVSTDITYQNNIGELSLGLVRYHAYEMVAEGNPKCWINYTTQKWNGATVKTSLSALQGKVGDRMISIFNFPKWLCPDPNNIKYMPPSQANAFGDWCASLVDTINNNSPYRATYWEIFNELEGNYAGKMSELITIYNTAVVKMKAKDPSIKVGALALTQPWWNNGDQEQFYAGAAANLDFVSCHSYGMGSSNVPNTQIYKAAKDVPYYVGNNMRARMNTAGISASVPIFLGETNISYAWNLDPTGKMASNVGAVYDAIVLKSAIDDKKLASVQFFNDRDGFYGAMSASNVKRPTYEVLKMASKNLAGTFVKSLSTTEDSIQALAVINANGNKTIMLINRALNNKSVTVNFTGYTANGVVFAESAIKNSLTSQNLTWSGSSRTFTMPSESVTFWVFSSVPLAVSYLAPLQGDNLPEGILLRWATATERNNAFFDLERSKNGVDFEKIATIQGNNNAVQTKQYSFLDKKPFDNQNYYRLRQTDTDGRFEYSNIVVVNKAAKINIVIAPNPIDDILKINTFSQNIEKATILNINGQIIKHFETVENEINVADLPKGIYFLSLKMENQEVEVKRFVKM